MSNHTEFIQILEFKAPFEAAYGIKLRKTNAIFFIKWNMHAYNLS